MCGPESPNANGSGGKSAADTSNEVIQAPGTPNANHTRGMAAAITASASEYLPPAIQASTPVMRPAEASASTRASNLGSAEAFRQCHVGRPAAVDVDALAAASQR